MNALELSLSLPVCRRKKAWKKEKKLCLLCDKDRGKISSEVCGTTCIERKYTKQEMYDVVLKDRKKV